MAIPTIPSSSSLISKIFNSDTFPLPENTPKSSHGQTMQLENRSFFLASHLLPNSLHNILNRLVLNNILSLIEDFDLFNPDQIVYSKSHFTTQQLCKIIDLIPTNFDRNTVTAMISLDPENDFDIIYMGAFIFMLYKIKFPPRIIQLIHSHIYNHTFTV